MKSQNRARTHKTMKVRPISIVLSALLLSACGTTADGAKTIKIEDDATIGDDVAAGDAADASAGTDAGANDVSKLDVKAWPDGIAPDAPDANLGELALQDAVISDATDQPDDAADGSALDVKAWPDGIAPDAGPDAIVIDVVVDVFGIDVTMVDTSTDSGSLDVKGLPDTFGTDAGPDIQVDISTADSGPDTSVADVPVNCSGANGCYACPPTTNAQFLNQCNNLSTAPFDNKGRLPLLNADGSLPPLP